MRPLGDRRSSVRLEVVGSLWATLVPDRRVRVINLSHGGALIASTVPPPLDSPQTMYMVMEGHDIRLSAHVRHVSQRMADEHDTDYGVGLEFTEACTAFLKALDRAWRPAREKSSD